MMMLIFLAAILAWVLSPAGAAESGVYVPCRTRGPWMQWMRIIDEGGGKFTGSYNEVSGCIVHPLGGCREYDTGTISGAVGDDGFVVASLHWGFFTIDLSGTYRDGAFDLTSTFNGKRYDFCRTPEAQPR
jgi:hypothetical protein